MLVNVETPKTGEKIKVDTIPNVAAEFAFVPKKLKKNNKRRV